MQAFLIKLTLLIFLIAQYTCVDWTETEKIIQEGINEGIFSGCVLGVSTHNSTVLKKAYGTTVPKRGFYAPPMQTSFKFDINRLTQVFGTNSILMDLYEEGNANLSRRVAFILKDFDNNGKRYITLENMLEHNSGFPASYDEPIPTSGDELLKKIEALKLSYTSESKFLYSQIGYTVLGHMITKLTNQTLKDSMSQILVLSGMRDTGFSPTSAKNQIVPSGYNNGVCHGIPSNRYAHALKDRAGGNAGLFSTLDNMVSYMQLMLNKGKMPNSARIFTEEAVDLYTSVTKERKYNNTFAKGWETVPLKDAPCGKKFSKNSFGLADPSGSYVWADKEKNVSVVFLANGNFPAQRTTIPSELQGRLSDQIMTALGF